MTKRDEFIKLSQSQVGYAETGSNITKYSKYFDTTAWQWFNTKKQGAEWCSLYLCYLCCMILGPEEALKFLGCPSPKNNCAAGVKYLYQYLEKKGYKVDSKAGGPGDIIVLNSKKHVGHIEFVQNGYYHTIEGNKNNKVARGKYKIGSSTISGVFHLPFEQYDSVPAPTPAPKPTPAPVPTPTKTDAFKVKTNGSPLALRVAPKKSSALIVWMKNGSSIKVSGTQDGWSRVTYQGRTGWAYSKWIAKV